MHGGVVNTCCRMTSFMCNLSEHVRELFPRLHLSVLLFIHSVHSEELQHEEIDGGSYHAQS